MTGAAASPKIAGTSPDGVLAENVTIFSSMQGVYGNLADYVFGIDTAQHIAGNRTMALAEVHDPSTNISEDGIKLTGWGSGGIGNVIHTRTVSISCKRQVMYDTKLPTLYEPRGTTCKPRTSKTEKRSNVKAHPFTTS